ncbi:MAG: NAD(P)H-dependent oxidoreductase [Acidaminococcus provencensis]|jgi:flavodoxin|uniref:flavodoxin n=1 Tax=Acidaminococcus TaxID=904 RepID=UPI000CFA0A1F|nr:MULTISPECIES: flavodoxin [Acidaminococcus]MCH4095881.1 NAD(P)H-dependent oxidoreductase [Acidaminococcus provencensis]RHK02411.1 flavodoxin [Acidaminococcus sp. AM05-11]
MSKTLLLYYSRSGENYVNGRIVSLPVGQTKKAIQYLAKATGADTFQVETVKPYSTDYHTCTQQALEELHTGARPAILQPLTDISAYDKVVIAGPCWWGTYPMAIFTQVEMLDFTGKTIYPLLTHEGSGLGHAAKDLLKACKGARLGQSLAIQGAAVDASEKQLLDWARACGLKQA